MRLNERHLMQLAAVLDTGSVSEGAALLGLTQPAVSRSLSALEARAGAPLFVKGRRPLQATALGHQLAAQGRIIMTASRQASNAALGFVKGTRGTVRIGGVPFFIDAIVSRMVGRFQTLEPEITIQQSYMNLPEVVNALSGEQIDLGIVAIGDASSGQEFEFTEILQGRNVVASRPGHPLMRKRPVLTENLTEYPWVAPLPGSPLMSDLQMILMSIGISDLSIRYAGGTLLSVVNYLATTDALAVLPYSVVFALEKENRITSLPYDIPQPNRSLGIMRRRDMVRTPAAERFVAHLLSEFEDLRYAIRRQENDAARDS